MYEFLIQVDEWPWIRFCKKAKRRMWTISEVQHTIVEEDVAKTIDPPDVVMCGTRLLYKFTGIHVFLLFFYI